MSHGNFIGLLPTCPERISWLAYVTYVCYQSGAPIISHCCALSLFCVLCVHDPLIPLLCLAARMCALRHVF